MERKSMEIDEIEWKIMKYKNSTVHINGGIYVDCRRDTVEKERKQ